MAKQVAKSPVDLDKVFSLQFNAGGIRECLEYIFASLDTQKQ